MAELSASSDAAIFAELASRETVTDAIFAEQLLIRESFSGIVVIVDGEQALPYLADSLAAAPHWHRAELLQRAKSHFERGFDIPSLS